MSDIFIPQCYIFSKGWLKEDDQRVVAEGALPLLTQRYVLGIDVTVQGAF